MNIHPLVFRYAELSWEKKSYKAALIALMDDYDFCEYAYNCTAKSSDFPLFKYYELALVKSPKLAFLDFIMEADIGDKECVYIANRLINNEPFEIGANDEA